MNYDYEYCSKASDYLKTKINFVPEIGIILGTGLGPLAADIEDPVEIPYKDIPNFLLTTNAAHAGKMIFGTISGRKVMCMSGRFHSYEGYSFEQLVIPVRVMKLMGVQKLILTNAAGAVNASYAPGDIMIISDQIKFNGASPLCGLNDERFGPRFFDVSNMYDEELREKAWVLAKESPLTFHEGVYFFMPGPQFETPAEIRAIRTLGGDAVGMSTVTEALTAAHCGIPVLGLSLISNMAAGMEKVVLSDEDVQAQAQKVAVDFSAYVKKLVGIL